MRLNVFFAVTVFFLAIYALGGGRSSPEPASIVLPVKAYNPKTVAPSIVKITTPEGTSGGTGFSVRAPSDHIVVVTNDHVCGVAINDRVYVRNGASVNMGNIIKRDFPHDLCAIDVGPYAPAPLPIADKELTRFDAVFVQGHPLLMPQAPVQGRVIDLSIEEIGFRPREDGTCPPPSVERIDLFSGKLCVMSMELMSTTLQIFPGNSGSPALNDEGAVIGVVNSGDNRTGWGAYIQLSNLKDFLKTL